MKKNKRVVVIGGGTGIFSVLTGLKRYPLHLSAIVSMADDGGSTGILREEFGILPPGDIRRALVALSEEEQPLANLLSYRFTKGSLQGHNLGNLLLTALTDLEGNFEKAVRRAEKILGVKGEVIPVTLDKARLKAKLENGQVIVGETNIDIPKHNGNLRIKKLWLKPACSANPSALKAIRQADLIVIGPGDLYTSIIPNLLVKGIVEAIKKSRAKKAYVCNIMTKFGETNNFTGKDFLQVIQKYLGEHVLDFALFNNHCPTPKRIEKYAREKAQFVEADFLPSSKNHFQVIKGDFLRRRGFIRHDPDKIGRVLFNLVETL